MENRVSQIPEFRNYYLSEYELFDGEAFITFNIVGISENRNEISVAVTDRGKISVRDYELLTNENERPYFEYGCMYEKVYIDDFEEVV